MYPLIVASTRPEVIKLSPLLRELDQRENKYIFVTTGQHYDRKLFLNFIEDLKIRKPDYDLKIGSGSQGYQTGRAIEKLEDVIKKEKPDVVIAEGDTNSVLSSALASSKLHIPFAHVEAGLRSWDRTMPEEMNRILADHLSSYLFAPTEESAVNLVNEMIPPSKIHIVGNTIVDATFQNLDIALKNSLIMNELPEKYLVLTLHRPENVDDGERLNDILKSLSQIDCPIIFPVHPRTFKILRGFENFLGNNNLILMEPLGYFDFLVLMKNSYMVLTDSGGIQEESITMDIPCMTIRTTTERPETVKAGGNIVAGIQGDSILKWLRKILDDEQFHKKMSDADNPYGDGTTSKKMVDILLESYNNNTMKILKPQEVMGGFRSNLIVVDDKLDGTLIKDAPFKILKVKDEDTLRYPFPDLILKKGQIIEFVENIEFN